MGRALVAVVFLAAVFATVVWAATPSLTLSPSSVGRGGLVLVRGSADGCPVGDTVTIISRAFVDRREFAGLPAILARVKSGGRFTVTTRIPVLRLPGRYGVTARCGGGNLGVLKYLTVRR
jgi:hypothetical protein